MRRWAFALAIVGLAVAVAFVLLLREREPHQTRLPVAAQSTTPRATAPATSTAPVSRPTTGGIATAESSTKPTPNFPGASVLGRPDVLPVDCIGDDCGECAYASDCPPDHACLADPVTRQFKCVRDECKSDDDCPIGTQCRRLLVIGSWSDTTGHCLPPGTKNKGDSCFAASTQDTCAPGLICYNGRCLSECTKADKCGTDEDCLDGGVGKACVPKCKECAQGSKCSQVATAGECYKLRGTDCEAGGSDACAEGEKCISKPDPVTKVVTAKCRRLCDPSAPVIGTRVCPEGEVCGFGVPGFCYKKCKMADPGSCPPGFACAGVSEDRQTHGCIELPPRLRNP